MPGAGEERAVGLEHGGCGEVEGALRVRAVGGDVLDEFAGAGDALPVNPGIVGDDGACVQVRQGGESAFKVKVTKTRQTS